MAGENSHYDYKKLQLKPFPKDNAGSFDRLIPLLAKHHSFLAIDLPGNGLSSRIPDGMSYHDLDYIYLLYFLCQEYNWDKISLLGHSMGSVLNTLFASMFPEKVDLLINLDPLRHPMVSQVTRMKNFMQIDQLQKQGEPPSFSYEILVERLIAGSGGSVSKETAKFLLKRNIKQSEKLPGNFYFTRDLRTKNLNNSYFTKPLSFETLRRLKMPHLFIKATKSREGRFEDVMEILKENKNFEFHHVDTTHHLHLTSPEKVAPIISEFIKKHRKIASKL